MYPNQILQNIRKWLAWFMAALLLSGLTAFPLEWELQLLFKLTPYLPNFLDTWVIKVYTGVAQTNAAYPFIAYGTDWLAFAHIILAILFIGPYRNPIQNIWIFQFGLIACILVFPLAFIAGAARDIPVFWRLIDCSFGVVGFIPLWHCYQKTKLLSLLTFKK